MRVRITFTKQGPLRYIGHLDLHTLLVRGTRRAGWPLAYTQGFHPKPRLQLASALPLGFSSRGEIADLWLNVAQVDLETLRANLQASLPAGIDILKIEAVDESAPALQTQLIAADYEVTLPPDPPPDLPQRVLALLQADSLPRERRGKPYDLRPLILALEIHLAPEGAAPILFMRLAAREGATGRPEEVLNALGLSLEDVRIERTQLIFDQS